MKASSANLAGPAHAAIRRLPMGSAESRHRHTARKSRPVNYDLSHLVQDAAQAVVGPIQDDEALLLYSICRVTCAARVAEFGGQSGYSARNFVAAISGKPGAALYTVDMSPVPLVSPIHRFIHKAA